MSQLGDNKKHLDYEIETITLGVPVYKNNYRGVGTAGCTLDGECNGWELWRPGKTLSRHLV